uniref:Small ribosomal subunit protein uS10 domain-containing protein n=1 Tax=Solanum lycopersicum TaxID=4081 RepID=A0A3Q7H5M9_SOLLC
MGKSDYMSRTHTGVTSMMDKMRENRLLGVVKVGRRKLREGDLMGHSARILVQDLPNITDIYVWNEESILNHMWNLSSMEEENFNIKVMYTKREYNKVSWRRFTLNNLGKSWLLITRGTTMKERTTHMIIRSKGNNRSEAEDIPPSKKLINRSTPSNERPPKVTTTKIGIVIRSFDHPFLENHFWGLPTYIRKIGLPESRVLYTVLRSPHIDKKSREQFFMKIKKEFLVIKIKRHELRKKFFR